MLHWDSGKQPAPPGVHTTITGAWVTACAFRLIHLRESTMQARLMVSISEITANMGRQLHH
jgi:hypothetical protein